MSTKKIIQIGLVTSIFVAAIISFYASGHPDGLEFVAEQVGFLNTAKDSAVAVIGVLLTAVVSFGLFSFLKKR